MFSNKTKMFLLLTLIFVAVLGVSTATAADIDSYANGTADTLQDVAAQDSADDIQTSDVSTKGITKNMNEKTLKSEGEGTFADLETDIAGGEVTLTKDYVQGDSESALTISEDKIIDGNGCTITATKGIFTIDSGVTFTLKNTNIFSEYGPTYSTYYYDFNNKGNLILDNVTFTYTQEWGTRTYGYPIYMAAYSNVSVNNSKFSGYDTNAASIYGYGTDINIVVDNTEFTNYNTANTAIYMRAARSNLTLTNSNFTNAGATEGNGINYGGALYLNNYQQNAYIDNCIFDNITSSYRGAAMYVSGNVTVKNSKFTNLYQSRETYNGGAIWVDNSRGILTLENNVMENITSNTADIYFNNGQLNSTLEVTGSDVVVDQEAQAQISFNVTDDNGNSIDFRSSPFTLTIDGEPIPVTYANGTMTATFDASYDPGEYSIVLEVDDARIVADVEVPEVNLTVNDIGLYKYANVSAAIQSARTATTVTIDGPVFRGSSEESIVIDKVITVDFNGNTINAKQGKVFDITENAVVTIKNAVITNVGNTNTNIYNTEGRIANVTGGTVIFENVVFENSKAPNYGSSAKGSFILALEDESIVILEDCEINNCTGTFINNVNGEVTIIGTDFLNNNLGSSHDTIIANGGDLIVSDSLFINNTVNIATIRGQSNTLASSAYGSYITYYNKPLTIENSIFIDNYAGSGRGAAVNTQNDTNITNSLFINNRNNQYSNKGGAVFSEQGDLTIDGCVFVNNSARYSVSSWSGVSANEGTAIYNAAGNMNIKNSIIISNVTEASAVYNDAKDAEVVANGNYWGTNDIEGRYDSGSSADEITVDNWVIFNVTMETDLSEVMYKDVVTAKATLNTLTDGTQILDETVTLPDYGEVTFTSEDGVFEEESVAMVDGVASASFTVHASPYTFTASYPNAEAEYTGEATMPEPQVYVLNDGNWTTYFNDDGTINDSIVVPYSELQFEGTFNGRDMVINMPVQLNTAEQQAVLNNCTIYVVSKDVNVTNLQMDSEDQETPLITIEASNALVEGNNLTLTNTENNVITHAIEVVGDNAVIRNNLINTTGPENNIEYGGYGDVIQTLYTTSISASGNNLVIDNNIISTKKNDQESDEMGTIYGVYVWADRDEPNTGVQITNNEITTESDVYAYGITVNDYANVLVESNNIVTTGNSYADGMQLGTTTESIVNDNTVVAYGPDQAYGVILSGIYAKTGPGSWDLELYLTQNNNVTNNEIIVMGNHAWAVEVYDGEKNEVSSNNITVGADNGIGVAIGGASYTTVDSNNIQVTATMENPVDSYDSIDPYTAGVKIVSSSDHGATYTTVNNNTIRVKAPVNTVPAVNSTVSRTTVTNNFLLSPLGGGNAAVKNTGYSGTVEDNTPTSLVITNDTYETFFDENSTLKSDYDGAYLTVSGDISDKLFILDGVDVSITNDGTSTLYDSQIFVGNNATVILDGIVINNTDMEAIVLESEGNLINNSVIVVNSSIPLHAVEIAADYNIIANTAIIATIPSSDVQYDKDYVGHPQSSALYISSNNNVVDNVAVSVDASEVAEGSYYPSIDAIDIQSPGKGEIIEGNAIVNTTVIATGSNYVYGINVGRSNNTILEDVTVAVGSDYYTNGIQLFDAENTVINGEIESTADVQAYGVYATAMGTGSSNGIGLLGLNITATAPDATCVLIEGASNVVIAGSTYDVIGDNATAVKAYVDWMGNVPTGIIVTDIEATSTTDESDILYFGQAADIIISDSNFYSTGNSYAVFNNVTDPEISGGEFVNVAIVTYEETNLVVDGVTINNTDFEAVYFESEGNLINNSIIEVNSAYPLHAVEFAADSNMIANTTITATIASSDVQYDKDYVGYPQSSALYIASNNNVVDNVAVSVDGSEVAEGAYYPSIDAIDIQSTGKDVVIEGNTIVGTTVMATGPNYVYGINVGRAKDTTIEDANIIVKSDYYTNGVQLFDAVDTVITGDIESYADVQAYGVYSTAMGVGTSSGINLTGLDITVEAPDATAVLIEGASDVVIADSTYVITGEEAAAIIAHVDWMGNKPANILITGMDIDIDGTEDNSILYFGACENVTITENDIQSTSGSQININSTPGATITDNYIVIKDMFTGSFGNYAVITTEEDTVVENNTPTPIVVEELEDEVNKLQEQLDSLEEQNEELQAQIDELRRLIEELAYKDTSIVFDEIHAEIGTTVTITGALTDENGNCLSDQTITLIIDDEEVNVTTEDGVFEYDIECSTLGEKTVTAKYAGIEGYKASEAELTFEVTKHPVELTVDDIADVIQNNNVTITGTLTKDDGSALKRVNIGVYINGEKTSVQTDLNGVYTLTVAADTLGENEVKVTYYGNSKYEAMTVTTTFTVTKNPVVLTVEDIDEVRIGDEVTITGTLTKADGSALKRVNIGVYINGEKTAVKTDTNGVYTLTVAADTLGENEVKVTYYGNSKYEAMTVTTTFDVIDASASVIVIDEIGEVYAKDDYTITGTLTYEGEAVASADVDVTIGDEIFVVTTDANGVFTVEATADAAGTYDVTATFAGDETHDEATAEATFDVVRRATIVTVDDIADVSAGEEVTITGALTTADGSVLKHANIVVYINGVKTAVQTDLNGAYTVTTTATQAGENTVKVTYSGNSKYDGATIETTFTVA